MAEEWEPNRWSLPPLPNPGEHQGTNPTVRQFYQLPPEAQQGFAQRFGVDPNDPHMQELVVLALQASQDAVDNAGSQPPEPETLRGRPRQPADPTPLNQALGGGSQLLDWITSQRPLSEWEGSDVRGLSEALGNPVGSPPNLPPRRPGSTDLEALGMGPSTALGSAANMFVMEPLEAFSRLVDRAGQPGGLDLDDPQNAIDAFTFVGGITSSTFAARVTQDAMRTRSRARADTTAETGEPFTAPRDINLEVSDAGQGRFNIRAQVGDEQAVDAFVRHMQTRHNDPEGVLQFGRINVEEPWQRQGIATAIQEHLEATTGKPFIPDGFLTQHAYDRWMKIDPDAVRGHVRMADGDDAVYQRSMVADLQDQMRTGKPWTETARMAEVRRAYAAGELRSPIGQDGAFTLRGQPMPQPEGLRGEFTLSTGGASDRNIPTINFDIRRTARQMGEGYRYHVEMRADGQSIGYAVLHPVPEVNAFKFGNIEINKEPTNWRRRGLASALQQTLEARLERPMVPDTLLTREAYDRWRKIDPEAVEGNYKPPTHADDVYWERIEGRPYEETARMRQVREDAAAGNLREPRIRREDYSLGMGAARDTDTPTPRQLDPAGYYSHAHDVTQRLQGRGTPEQMWRGIERGGVREVEVRQLGLDELLLGRPIAEARRRVVDHVAELGRMRQEAKDLSTREGQDRWIARHEKLNDGLTIEGERSNRLYHLARERQRRLNEADIPVAERRLHAAQQNYDHQYVNRPQQQVTREDIVRHIEENRPNIARQTYSPPKMLSAIELEKAITALEADRGAAFNKALMNATGGRMIPEVALNRIISEIRDHRGTALGAMTHAADDHYRLPRGTIGNIIKEVTGHPVADFSFPSRPTGNVFIYGHVTLDPKNPSLTGTTLRIDSPASAVVERLWAGIPPKDAAILRAAWRDSDEALRNGGHADILELRRRNQPLLNRIEKEIGRDHFVDSHYGDLDIFGHYMSSVQRLTPGGATTFVPHQVQSGWGAAIAGGEGATRYAPLPGHSIVTNLRSWLDPTLRDIVRNAVESGADSISLPSAETVFRYNPPGDDSSGLRRLYNEDVHRRFQAIMKEFDSKYSSRGDRTNTLYTYEGDPNVTYRAQGQQSGTIKRVNGTIEDARNGFSGVWTTYPLTPAVRRNFEQGRGMRLFSGGVPVDGDEDGQTVQP